MELEIRFCRTSGRGVSYMTGRPEGLAAAALFGAPEQLSEKYP